MKRKMLPLLFLTNSLLLVGCGKNPTPATQNNFNYAYEFASIESVIAETVRPTIEMYSNSYMEFKKGPISIAGYEQYRFSYVLSYTFGETTVENWYDEYGSYSLLGGDFTTTYSFTHIDGKRSNATSANTLSYELAGDSLRVKVHNSGTVIGTFLMNNVDKRVPAYVNDANYEAKIRLDQNQESVDKYVISKAFVDNDNNCYFTYYDAYNANQNCIVKEEGYLTTDIYIDGAEPSYQLKVNKVSKYFHDIKISEEVVDITRGYVLGAGDFDLGHNFSVFFEDDILNTYESNVEIPPYPLY